MQNFDDYKQLDIYKCYEKSPYLSVKHSSYFQTYSDLLEKYRNKPITFVEIGVLNGGSLFMWREYFGDSARIIGIDLNPIAKRWEKEGFEIFIGSQSDTNFWDEVLSKIGNVDIILDDGGHTYEQQIITATKCIPFINNGGLLIVEDTHTSYFNDFGYPSKYSFIEWSKMIADNINSRFPAVNIPTKSFINEIFSLTFYESIVSFKIDRRKCFESSQTFNNGVTLNAEDFRFKETSNNLTRELTSYLVSLGKRFPNVKKVSFLIKIKNIFLNLINQLSFLQTRIKLRKLKKHWM